MNTAQLPQAGISPLVAKTQLTALKNDASDDHRHDGIDPRFGSGVEGAVEAEFSGELE